MGLVALQNPRLLGEELAGVTKIPAGFKQDAAPEPKAEALDINASFQETPEQRDARMKWWREARFGMFVHWGLFSAAGGTWHGKKSTFLGCWVQTSLKIPKEEYAAELMPKFTGEHFDPDFIARLAEETGMKYIIPIAKHHEGFALFDSKVTDYKISNTPAKRDWIRELSDASRRRGLKVGYYYSQNLDWHHTGEECAQDRYFNELVLPQLKELLSNYGDLSILWFDIPGGVINATRAKSIVEMTKRLQPGIVINNRLGGGFKGDTQTPEQFIPPTGLPGRDWETCQTINDTWEYTHYDRNWKSPTTLIRQLIDTASKGGNFLLNIGPKADGTVPQNTIDTLHAIGGWMKVHGNSIYGTTASPFPHELPWGRCTQKALGNGLTRLYLHIFKWPFDSILRIPALQNEVVAASLLSEPGAGPLKFSRAQNGDTLVQLPTAEPNDYATVVTLDVKGAPAVVEQPIVGDEKGIFKLDSALADIHAAPSTTEVVGTGGGGESLYYDSHLQTLATWPNLQDHVSWTLDVKRPGRYNVDVTYAAKQGEGACDYGFELGNQHLSATTGTTRNWLENRTDHLGTIKIKSAGRNEASFRLIRKTGKGTLKLKSITLTPVP
jgi:alpha-L-fucosidase